MANRFPLIANSSTNQIQELPVSDYLDLSQGGIVNSVNIQSQNISITGVSTIATCIVGSAVTINSSGANVTGVVTATSMVAGTFSGAGTSLTALNASNITTGTISGDRGVSAGSTIISFVEYNGTTATAGQFDGGSTTPSGTTRLNYGGYLYATRFYGDGSNLSALNASNLSTGTVSNTLFNTNSNAYGTRTVSTSDPTGGSDGDIWYKYV